MDNCRSACSVVRAKSKTPLSCESSGHLTFFPLCGLSPSLHKRRAVKHQQALAQFLSYRQRQVRLVEGSALALALWSRKLFESEQQICQLFSSAELCTCIFISHHHHHHHLHQPAGNQADRGKRGEGWLYGEPRLLDRHLILINFQIGWRCQTRI